MMGSKDPDRLLTSLPSGPKLEFTSESAAHTLSADSPSPLLWWLRSLLALRFSHNQRLWCLSIRQNIGSCSLSNPAVSRHSLTVSLTSRPFLITIIQHPPWILRNEKVFCVCTYFHITHNQLHSRTMLTAG